MIVGRRHTDRFGRLVGTDPGGPILRTGRAPCVVAFHGFTGTTSEIRPLLERLTEGGYAVHAPLLPGHGSSPSHLQDATFDAWVAAMKAEVRLAQERHGSFVLCGFSLGSLVALELAMGSPEGLCGLVLLGNAITLTIPVRAALGFVDRRAWALPDWYLLKLWSSDVRDPEQKKRIAAYDRDPLRAALEVYRGGRRVEPRLSLVTCPTLILHGGLDRVCPPSNARLVAQRLGSRAVETKLYPKSAHLIAADVDRSEVADDVVRFVGAIGGPPA
jgi:carboxylesterase